MACRSLAHRPCVPDAQHAVGQAAWALFPKPATEHLAWTWCTPPITVRPHHTGVAGSKRAEAVKTAVYILNGALTRSLDGVTPYEAWHGPEVPPRSWEPRDVTEALDDVAWKAAMYDEMASILDNKTKVHYPLPAGHKAIGLKWVYKVKRDAEYKVIKHKARLVTKGYAQRQGVDFEEVFALVARMETVCVYSAAHSKWEVHNMDVKSAFLNGHLAEEVYVVQPPGYITAGKKEQVLRL
ncbi:hypothetical protein QYE76_041868 [Lolium multiflorum]|uniref:Reverse transcriptase Ty1/copia-type domain-containing protein n=1 Tax=Lolium multiflorum TaxID=4521 RepID=A0AAD8TDT4_LOLMU|nr:hypothetical protein QYE76_041868 [Lolium multiflorum]